MKTSAFVLASILALSAGAWTFFYFLAAGEPLTSSETLVVVGICAAGVFAVRHGDAAGEWLPIPASGPRQG